MSVRAHARYSRVTAADLHADERALGERLERVAAARRRASISTVRAWVRERTDSWVSGARADGERSMTVEPEKMESVAWQ